LLKLNKKHFVLKNRRWPAAAALRHSIISLGLLTVLLLSWEVQPASTHAPKPLRPDINIFIDEMVTKHQFVREELQLLFRKSKPQPAILRAISAPGTARPWHDFRRRTVDAARISGGVRFWEQHAVLLARASREYGVPEEIIVATIGIETLYGRIIGTFRVLDALTVLAFEYPPRVELFRGELEEFLLLARESGMDVLNVKGSYAGAMGVPQFLPSSYRKYAVDFDADGKRDLWGVADAIGSVANYYRVFGWRTGEPVVVPVDVGDSMIDTMLEAGIKPGIKVADIRLRGLTPQQPVKDDADVALFSVELESGTKYWLGLQNFYVITRYNRSINYAMAVNELAGELRAAMNLNAHVSPPALSR
jgi:membrane-bound lytic murein transglycosylase B